MILGWLANPSWGCRHFPCDFWSSYEYLIHYQSEDSRANSMLTIELRVLIIFWARSPISFNHLSFWYPFKYRWLNKKSNSISSVYLIPNWSLSFHGSVNLKLSLGIYKLTLRKLSQEEQGALGSIPALRSTDSTTYWWLFCNKQRFSSAWSAGQLFLGSNKILLSSQWWPLNHRIQRLVLSSLLSGLWRCLYQFIHLCWEGCDDHNHPLLLEAAWLGWPLTTFMAELGDLFLLCYKTWKVHGDLFLRHQSKSQQSLTFMNVFPSLNASICTIEQGWARCTV